MLYQTIEVRKLNPVIGAEISGIDLSRDLGNQQFEEVHDALMENLVIFFRDQTITVEQYKAFGRRFGKLHVHSRSSGDQGRRKLKARRRGVMAQRRLLR